jgi:uncharacterized membrane protein (DUF373 family)
MKKYIPIALLLVLCLLAVSTLLDIARYVIEGLPNRDFFVLPGGVFMLLILLPAIYALITDLIKKRGE